MLIFASRTPRRAFDKALETASTGMPAMGLEGSFDVSTLAFRAFGAQGDTLETMRPDKLVPTAWKFAVLEGGNLAAFVTVRRRGDFMVAGQMEFAHGRPAMVEALKMADELASGEGMHEIRFVDIPIVDASFLWVTGDRPTFVDRTQPRTFTEEELMNELGDRLVRKTTVRPLPEPRPPTASGPGHEG